MSDEPTTPEPSRNRDLALLIRDISALVVSLTALSTALGWGCHNSSRIDRNEQKIEQVIKATEKEP